jgi:predicted ribosomally synthesized peptide with SipW-like signal peptide
LRRIWFTVLVFVLASGIAGGATLAYFNDTASNQNNQFMTGTLELAADRDQGDSVPGPMFYTIPIEGQTDTGDDGLLPTGLWKPGDTNHRVFQLENIGTLDALLKNTRASLDSGSRYLADKLEVKVTTDPAGSDVVASGTLGSFIDGDQSFVPGPISLVAGDIANLHFWVTLPQDADSSYQDETLKAQFSVYAEQQANNL